MCEYLLDLCVSYTCMALTNPQLFPQPALYDVLGPARLYELVADECAGGAPLPSGFLARLAEHTATEGLLDEVAGPVLAACSAQMAKAGILADFHVPLRALVSLLEAKPLRLALVHDPRFHPLKSAAPPMSQLP
ncbi:hypothetical protein T492DRAFT_468760 [Pavlovales sp. CCMP2436]|nr:hypothetical protein T492DRAFT_468760 [Pavlovales sp. CCMP2436]